LAFCQSNLLPINITNEIIMTEERYIWHIIRKYVCPGNEPDKSKSKERQRHCKCVLLDNTINLICGQVKNMNQTLHIHISRHRKKSNR